MERLPKEPQEQSVLIQRHFDTCMNILNSHSLGNFGEFDEFAFFALKRENHYYFRNQLVHIGLFPNPLENNMDIEDPNFTKTKKGEQWIEIYITPNNIDNPLIAKHSEKGESHFYTEALVIFISSEGRAYQLISWTGTNGPQTEDDLPPTITAVENPPGKVTSFEVDHNPMDEIKIIDSLPLLEPADLDRLNLLLEEIQAKGKRIHQIELGVVEPDPE